MRGTELIDIETARPRFTVVVPLFNKRDYVRECLECIRGQSIPAARTIVVDDGSTDGGAAVAESVLREMGQGMIIRQSNSGPGIARNRGMSEVREGWVAFLDADDIWAPDHIAELGRIVSECPAASFISTRALRFAGPAGLPWRPANPPARRTGYTNYFDAAARSVTAFNSSCVALHWTVQLRIGGFSSALRGEDSLYWAKTALSFACAASDRVTVGLRWTESGAMASSRGHAVEDVLVRHLCGLKTSGRMDRRAIEKFVNRRTIIGIKERLLRDDVPAARRVADIVPWSRRGVQVMLLSLALRLPTFVVRKGVASIRSGRTVFKQRRRASKDVAQDLSAPREKKPE